MSVVVGQYTRRRRPTVPTTNALRHRVSSAQRRASSYGPVADDVVVSVLATELDLTGGNIRNIALQAAYIASTKNRIIDMSCVIDAIRREQVNAGMVVDVTALTNTGPAR